jgi:hypothetical protein
MYGRRFAEAGRVDQLSYDLQRRMVQLFYALRNAIGRDPASPEAEKCFEAFRLAYAALTSRSLSPFPEAAERRRWISALFARLVTEIDFEVWNTTPPTDAGCREVA